MLCPTATQSSAHYLMISHNLWNVSRKNLILKPCLRDAVISSIKQTHQELLTWSLESSLIRNKMLKSVLGNVAMSPHLKEQFTQKWQNISGVSQQNRVPAFSSILYLNHEIRSDIFKAQCFTVAAKLKALACILSEVGAWARPHIEGIKKKKKHFFK